MNEGIPTPSGEPGAVQVLEVDGSTHVVLSGEIDSDLGRDLQQAAADAAVAGLPIVVDLLIDLSDVPFMDSAGLAFIARLCGRGQDRITLLVASQTVLFLLEVTGMKDAVDIVDVRTEGDAATLQG